MRFVSLLCAALVVISGVAHAQTRPAAPAASTAGLVDINSASRDELMTLDGIGEVKADAIIRWRPFKAKTDLVERRVIPEALYEKLADKLVARAVPTPPAPRPTPTPPTPRR